MEYKTDKSIVRESKVRNVFHKVCKKELFYTNIKVNAQSEELLKSSTSLFAYPSSIGGGSCLAVSKLTQYGKAPDVPFVIKGHTDPISCFEFSPFHDRVIATGSRDCTIKLWKVPEDDDQEFSSSKGGGNISAPLITLPKQSKRIVGVNFHPSVDSLFISSTMDFGIDLWDLSQTTEPTVLQRLVGAEDIVMSWSWNTWSGGNLLATSCRDKKMRLYDPRAGSHPIHEVITHEGAQGFKLAWADSNGLDMLCTVGANKSAQRQLYLWDPRQLGKATTFQQQYNVTTDSSILNPIFDYGTNILYLGGKGDGIYYYEIDKQQAHLMGKAAFGNVTQSAISLLPKSVVDVSLCEIDRFLRLTKDTVEMVSFIVPRKSQLFQEDIFPPAPNGDPTTDVGVWFQDKNQRVTPICKSMKPDGLQSIYDVSEEEGGKSKQKDKLDQITSVFGTSVSGSGGNGAPALITESTIKQEVEGWLFNSYEPRYLKIVKDHIYCFLNEDSAQAIWDTPLLAIKYVDIYDDPNSQQPQQQQTSANEWSLRFNIILQNSKEYRIECPSVQMRDDWINSINAHRELKKSSMLEKLSTPVQTDSPTLSDFHVVNNSPVPPSPATINNNLHNLPPISSLSISKNSSLLSRNSSSSNLRSSGGIPNTTTTTTTTNNSNNNNNIPNILVNSSNVIQWKSSDIVIEGSLFELVPGLLWNSNQEKWFVVSEGILYTYRNKSQKNTEQPLETIHLEKAVSVHKTKEIFKIEGFSFQLSTPNRIIHLLVKTKEERLSWLSVLKQNLKSASESKPSPLVKSSVSKLNVLKDSGGLKSSTGDLDGADPIEIDLDDENNQNEGGVEEEEEELLDGQISRKLPGIFSMWGKCYMSLLAEDLFLSKSKLAATPDLRIPLQTVSAIKKLSPQEFTLYDNQNQVVCNFKTLMPPTEDFDDCSRWMEGLEAARKRSIDIIKLFALESGGDSSVDEESNLSKYLDLTAVKNGKQKLLIQVKGKRKVRVRLCKLSGQTLNSNNSFILDAGPRLFIWSGSKASRVNKAKAVDFANRIRTKERGGKSTLIQLDEGKNDDSVPEFWDILGGKPSQVLQSPTQEEQDQEYIKTSIYRIGMDAKKNTLRARLAWEGTDWKLPNKEILHTRFVFIIDCQTELFIWIGKESSSAQRKMAGKVALALYNQSDRQEWSKITRVTEFGENNLFKEKFANYPGMLPISTSKMETKSHVAVQRAEHKISDLVERMQKTIPFDEEKIFTDPLEGKVKIWKIEDFEKIDHPSALYSQFYCGDSYIVLYSYRLQNKEAHVIYYYLGRESTINEKGTSAYLTVDLHESLQGQCVQTRVVQNKECRNFLNLFKGQMIIHRGKYLTYDQTKNALYEVRGVDQVDIRAVQVDSCSSQSLNTQHVFLLKTKSKVYIWNGKNAPALERETAIKLAETLSSSGQIPVQVIEETQEPQEFFDNLEGGKLRYFSDTLLTTASKLNSIQYRPRLFICTNSSGINEVNEEAYPFSQDDLDISHVALLDVQSHIYIYLGPRAAHRTKKTAMEVVCEFVKTSKLGHTDKTQIIVIEPFCEPIAFRSYFRAWSLSKYPKNKVPLEEKPGEQVQEVLKNYLREVYTYEELLSDPLPPGVDPKKLETYLPDEEFEKIFHMPRKEFDKISQWKREQIKKNAFLF